MNPLWGMFERPHLPAATTSILSALSGVLTRAVEHKFLRSKLVPHEQGRGRLMRA